ncbi:MAG: DUF4350 domain-containing protein [Candidatus Kapaibacterium sp.]
MKAFLFFILIVLPLTLCSQQVSDTSYSPIIKNPEYNVRKGPVVFIDEGHNNFHTKQGRYRAFSDLLEKDGYVVTEYEGEFTKNKLSQGKILVISNALNDINVSNWYLPTPSAFTKTEIETVRDWVNEGGSLFLIADHMPMAGAAYDLALEFGFEFSNGFVFHTETEGTGFFNLKDGTLIESTITKGRDKNQSVEKIVSFTGQGFKIPEAAKSILTFDEKYFNLLPDTAWVFNDSTIRLNVKGWSQLAYRTFGKGKVVVSGEAAMFTAQLAGPKSFKVGMNNEDARENHILLLNIIRWLDGKLQDN